MQDGIEAGATPVSDHDVLRQGDQLTTTLSPAHATLLDTVPAGASNVVTADVDYELDGTALRGYLAYDDTVEEQRPGVLVVHDWTGVGEYVQVRCQMLARLGYVAFAPDIYGREVRPQGGEAAEVAGEYYGNPALMRSRAQAGLAQLLAQPGVDAAQVAAIGYCFGGSVALALAGTGADIAGVVTFHGALSTITAADAPRIKAQLLVLSGAADPVVPDDAVVAFENTLREAPELDWQLTSYSGAMHAFTLPEAAAPDHGANYHPIAERRSWVAMRTFFDEIFAG